MSELAKKARKIIGWISLHVRILTDISVLWHQVKNSPFRHDRLPDVLILGLVNDLDRELLAGFSRDALSYGA